VDNNVNRNVSPNLQTPRSVVVAAGGGLAAWPELVVAVVQALDGSDLDAADGALDALFKARARRNACVRRAHCVGGTQLTLTPRRCARRCRSK
jgi:hypothetical protein